MKINMREFIGPTIIFIVALIVGYLIGTFLFNKSETYIPVYQSDNLIISIPLSELYKEYIYWTEDTYRESCVAQRAGKLCESTDYHTPVSFDKWNKQRLTPSSMQIEIQCAYEADFINEVDRDWLEYLRTEKFIHICMFTSIFEILEFYYE